MYRWFRDLIYNVVFFCLRVAQPEYFRRILIEGDPLDDPQQPLMVVANHPYGIQDAFLVAYAYPRPFYFAATAMNFQTRDGDAIKKKRLMSWLLTQCHVLPIVRNRSEGHLRENARTFDAAARRVAEGYALCIFAEGDSRGNQWNLLKLKMGSAQIALQVADLLHEADAPLQIQVAGLTYTNWNRPFKSTVTLKFAAPLVVEPIDLGDKQAVRAARKEITDQLTHHMQELTVHIPDEHQDLAGKIARFYCVEQWNDFDRLQAVGRKIAEMQSVDVPDRRQIEDNLDAYLALADELHVYPGEERHKTSDLLLALLAVPAYIGVLLHWPIVWATRRTVPLETTVLHALGSKRVMRGISFTLAWYALAATVALAVGITAAGAWGVPIALAVLVAMAWCGLAASRFVRHVNLLVLRLWPGSRRFRRYRRLGNRLYRRLESLRGMPPGVPCPPAETMVE